MQNEQIILTPRCSFDRSFVFHAIPHLITAAAFGGALVQHDLETFSAASARVMAVARKYGCLHLTPASLSELEAWIDSAVLAAIDAAPPRYLVLPARLGRITGEPQPTQREETDVRAHAAKQWRDAA